MPPFAVDSHGSLSELWGRVDIAQLVNHVVHASQLRSVSNAVSH